MEIAQLKIQNSEQQKKNCELLLSLAKCKEAKKELVGKTNKLMEETENKLHAEKRSAPTEYVNGRNTNYGNNGRNEPPPRGYNSQKRTRSSKPNYQEQSYYGPQGY